MRLTESPVRTRGVQAASRSRGAVLPVAVILVVVLRETPVGLAPDRVGAVGPGAGLVWASEAGTRARGASSTGTSSARPIPRRSRAGRALKDRTRRTGWRRGRSGRGGGARSRARGGRL